MPPSFYQRVFSTTIRAAEDSLTLSILRVMYRLSGPLEMMARGMINGRRWYKRFENSDTGIKGYLIAEEVEGASLGSDDVDLVILYTHGGGFRLGHPLIPLALFIQWIQTFKANHNAKVQILSLEYPLSPEHPFPAARDCVIQCYTWLVMSQGISPSRIVFAGDSAGGNLAAIAAIKISNSQIEGNSIFLPPPSSLILVSPCFNAFTTAESFQSNEMNDIISIKWFDECLHDYIASTGLPPNTPSISPIFEKDISKMPRFWACIGEYEVMRDDAETFVKKAQSQGVTAELVVENANQHNYAVSCLVSRNFAHLKAADQVGVFLFGKTASSP